MLGLRQRETENFKKNGKKKKDGRGEKWKLKIFFFSFLFLSDEGPTLETLDFTIRISSTPTAYATHYVYTKM